MGAPSDEIYEIVWKGPFDWSKRKIAEKEYMIYAIFGTHCVYGADTLLYIGRTKRFAGERLEEHKRWVEDESGGVTFRVGKIKQFDSWESQEATGSLTPSKWKLVKAIETLLIYAHQPAYNSRGLQEPSEFHRIRVFNSGKFGNLLPEVSYRYYMDPK